VSRNDWIAWAEPCWADINETKTLNVNGTKQEGNTRHICPLQLDLIDRLVRLYSDPGELVFDPFSGLGSTGVVALKHSRRYLGIELSPEWHADSLKRLAGALRQRQANQRTLFDGLVETEKAGA
jgi:DNA modification methylase